MWLNYSLLRQRVARLDRGGAADLHAEVAVFTDERSAAYLPLAGAAGEGSALNRAFYREPVAALSQIGAPVRHYLLSDLASPRFRSERVKLAIFPNAFRVDQSMRRTIRERLQRGGRTLVYVYAPGVVDQQERAGPQLASEMTGIALDWRLSPGSRSTSLQDAGPISVIRQDAGSRYGPTYGVAPWLYGVDTNATVLGRYFGRGHPALLLKQFSGHRVVLSGAPGLPASVWRGLAEYAGVHLYTPAVGDVVEAAGNMLMLHGTDAGARTLRLPFSANRVVEDTLGSERVVCTACDHFQTGPMLAGGVLQYWLE